MNSYSGSFANIAEKFAEAGIECVACDYRCYAKSTGEKGNFDNVEKLVNDHAFFLYLVRQKYPEQKLFIFGNSLGGHIALRLSLQEPDSIQGLLLSVPFIQAMARISKERWFKSALAMVNVFRGSLTVSPPQQNSVCRIQAAYEQGLADPNFYHGKIQVSTLQAMRTAGDQLYANLEMIKAPMIIFRAGMDKIVDNNAIQELYNRAGSTDKVLHDYPQAWHALSRDPDVYDVIEKSILWIKERI